MPSISSQQLIILSANHAQLTLVTVSFGTIMVDVLRTTGPTVITVTGFRDGVQQSQQVLSNPPASQVESQIDSAVGALLSDSLGQQMQFRSHLNSVSPLSISFVVANKDVVLDQNWWTET